MNMLASAFQLLRSGVTTTVDMAWGGRTLSAYNEGRVTTFDEQQVMRDTRRHYDTLWNQRDREREQLIEDGLVYVRRFFKPWEANVLPSRYRSNCL